MKVACVNLRLRVSLFKQWALVTSKTAIYESAYRSYLHTRQKQVTDIKCCWMFCLHFIRTTSYLLNSKMLNFKKVSHNCMFNVVTFSLFTMAGLAILSFWLVVSDCTLTPRQGSTVRAFHSHLRLKIAVCELENVFRSMSANTIQNTKQPNLYSSL